MIRTNYDTEADLFHVAFGAPGAVSDGSEELAPGVFVEFDSSGNVIGIEVLSIALRASGHYGQPAKAAAE